MSERTYTEREMQLERAALGENLIEAFQDEYSNQDDPLIGVVRGLRAMRRAIPTDQSALDRHDAELLSTVIGNVFPQTPGGYISRTEARAERAAWMREAADAVDLAYKRNMSGENWHSRARNCVLAIPTDQSALDRHDAELLSTVIGNVFPQTPGGYISRTEARAETAALLELAADLCKSVVKAGYREGWNIERDIRALIPADATAAFRERIAEAEQAGKDWEYKHHHDPEHDCCVECQLREYKLAEQQDKLLNDIRMGLKDAHETEMAECIQQAVREELEKVHKIFKWHDGVPNLRRYLEHRMEELRAAAGAPPAARTGSFLPCTWMAYARGGMGWCSCGNLGTEKEMVPYAAWDKHVSDNPNRATAGAPEEKK